jgi:hypothetical protein
MHPRWQRTAADSGFFRDEDRLGAVFGALFSASGAVLALLLAGLWRLDRAAAVAPLVVGVAGGQVFSGESRPLDSLVAADFDRQCADTLEVLFGRTERGLPPAIHDFCAPEVIAAIDRDYRDAPAHYPAGFVQTLTLLETKPLDSRPGIRHADYRGLLSSRSVASAQLSAIYLDCTFALAGAAPLNASGWRLVRVTAISRDDFYRDEEDRARRQVLGLSPNP